MIISPAPGNNVTEESWLNVELYDKRDQGFIETGLTECMNRRSLTVPHWKSDSLQKPEIYDDARWSIFFQAVPI